MATSSHTDLSQDVQILQRKLAALADAIYGMASDLVAFAPYCIERSREGGFDVLAQLTNLLTASESMIGQCASMRSEFTEAQMREIKLRYGANNLKLHIGAGSHHLDSWVNIDRYPADLALDVRWGLPFEDGSAGYVFLSHMLEH